MNLYSIILVCVFGSFHFSMGENCPTEGIAYLPHSKCSHFYICLNGESAEMVCPFSLYYNPETTQCDFPEIVSGCSGGTRPPITSTEIPTTTTELPPGTLTECGQSIFADNGTIQYKLNENYDAGELCVFMIQFESGFLNTTFTLENHGFGDLDSEAIAVYKCDGELGLPTRLGSHTQKANLTGASGAIVIFRTTSSSGTGFKLSFKRNAIQSPEMRPGSYVVFNNETYSPLNIPLSNDTHAFVQNHLVFTSDSKIISEPDTFLKLSVTGFGNAGDETSSILMVYSFETGLKFERNIQWPSDDGKVFEFKTRGLFILVHLQFETLPIETGMVTWEKVSTQKAFL
ncbi:Peritrophin-1 [Orchesella cincta]|uniref:Peritrophin-1 n=1 Tax=Orchesella cincta TaxID=48709 RepID=A0A1D2MAR4_ORCCI|nr:Peritrophin-1 [Orchesella cincta]